MSYYEGYLEFGGNEIANNARALGYMRTAPCAIGWLVGPDCPGLVDALDDEPYTMENIAEAPWYDAEDETTHRFFGVYVIGVEGIPDSTRTATVTEGVLDGGAVGRSRYATRRVRVRAVLSAQGRDALAAGFAWLDAALIPRDCAIHGIRCGVSDLTFFVDCPPPKGTVTEYGDWAEQKRNLYTNPSFEDPAAIPAGGEQSTDWSASGGFSLHVPAATTVTIPSLTAKTVLVTPRYAGQVMHAGSSDYVATGDGVPLRFFVPGPQAVEFGEGWWDKVMVVDGSYLGPYFDGDTTDDLSTNPLFRYSWTGTEHASQSIYETRTATERPETDVEYILRVNTLRRFLHGVSTVSGPTVERTLHRDDAWGYIVEFVVVAATPWVFSLTRSIDLPPTLPVVIQDAPYNLVPAPSAELASGTVVVQTNYATNPSFEVDAAGWTRELIPLTGNDPTPYYSSGRVVGELDAAGSAALRSKILGNGSTGASGSTILRAQTDVLLTGAPAGSRVSVSVWAGAVSVGGPTGAAITKVEIYVEWRDASTSYGSTTLANSTNNVEIAGKAWSLQSFAKPAAADRARVVVHHTVSWSSSATPANNSDIRAYVDALAVTVP